MGVNKLHDQLRPHYNQVDALVDYKGLCVGVDALCWVHRAAKHAISSGDHDVDTLCARVSKFFQDYVGALTRKGVRVLAVFDGQAPAAKRANRPRGNESWYAPCVTAARAAAAAAGATCVQAAGEADAELAARARRGDLCCVLTDDSDLVARGCPRILFNATLCRPNTYTLFGDEFELSSLGASEPLPRLVARSLRRVLRRVRVRLRGERPRRRARARSRALHGARDARPHPGRAARQARVPGGLRRKVPRGDGHIFSERVKTVESYYTLPRRVPRLRRRRHPFLPEGGFRAVVRCAASPGGGRSFRRHC